MRRKHGRLEVKRGYRIKEVFSLDAMLENLGHPVTNYMVQRRKIFRWDDERMFTTRKAAQKYIKDQFIRQGRKELG